MIVTACNAKSGLMYIIDGKPHLATEIDTRGACYVEGVLWYVTRDGLWRHKEGCETELLTRSQRDWHGLHNAGDCLLAVDPVTDEIVEFNFYGRQTHVWKWKPGSGRLHTNDVCVDNGDIYMSTFNLGICKNGVALGFGKHVQPHSVTRHEGLTYYCGSNLGQVMREGDVICEPGGFTRGLLATDEGFWVGCSQKRNGAGGTNACIQLYTWAGQLMETIDLPTNEVYAITQAAT